MYRRRSIAKKQVEIPERVFEVRAAFQEALLGWFRAHQRDLPWRRTKDPYGIWISEIMLQQTQVATVVPYYERFLARFPTVRALAEAPLEDVLALWAGLGYYSRARNLHKAAQEIVKNYNGQFPEEYEAVLGLPGVGRYTVGAILSIAYNRRVPLLDGNVMRLLTRVFAVRGDPRYGRVHELLWAVAEALIPERNAGDFNQSLMELGALVCIPDAPRCRACPLDSLCLARQLDIQTELPERAKGPDAEYVEGVSAVIVRGDTLLIARRFPEGLWGGLWEFPRGTRVPEETLAEAARRAVRETVGCEAEIGSEVARVKHGIAHRRITLHAFEGRILSGDPKPLAYQSVQWTTLEEMDRYPLSSPQARIVLALRPRQPTSRQLELGL
ncbi:MAG: A/G-specific adenine glycosylase [Armatimonadetes bacterium]|nr:A/G-specific adenine glycosylase [Armatimonadota bacterium]